MPYPLVVRPAKGDRIFISPVVKTASVRYLVIRKYGLGIRRIEQRAWEGSTWTAIPRPHLANVVRILADDRGQCRVTLHYDLSHLCTSSCQKAKPETVDDCVCVCGEESHGTPSGQAIPGTGDLVHCDDGTTVRTLIVWRGQTFTGVLHAELTAARLRSMEERRPPPL